MDNKEFAEIRRRLNKTQKEMARLMGVSIKAVHSYEQGWRSVPAHVERQLLLIIFRMKENGKKTKDCWQINKCPDERRESCPAWEFRSGDLCWFINGTNCEGRSYKKWNEKMERCRSCKVLKGMF